MTDEKIDETGFTSPIPMAAPGPGVVDFNQLYAVYAVQLHAVQSFMASSELAAATEIASANAGFDDADLG